MRFRNLSLSSVALVCGALMVATPALSQRRLVGQPDDGKKDAPKAVKKEAAAKKTEDISDDDLLLLDDDTTDQAEDTGPKKKIGVVNFVALGDAEEAGAEAVTKGLIKELSDTYALLPLVIASSADAGKFDVAAGTKEIAAGEKKLKSAQKRLGRRQMARAGKDFKAAIANFEKGVAALSSIDGILSAWAGLAETAGRQGDAEASAAAFAEIARLNPEFTLAEGTPPGAVRVYDAKKKLAFDGERGSIVVDATGAGAKVWVDGRELGTAPLKINSVFVGKHYVRVLREGLGAMGMVVDVKPGETTAVAPGFRKLDATGPVDLLKSNRITPAAIAAVAAAAKSKGMDGAMLGVVSKTRAALPTQVVVVAADGKARQAPALELDGDLLNVTIEAVKLSREIAKALEGEGTEIASGELMPGVKAGAEVPVTEVAMRFEARTGGIASRTPTRRRAIGAEEEGDEDGRRTILSGGKSRKNTLKDDTSVGTGLRNNTEDGSDKKKLAIEDVPLTEQAWFWPTVIGGGVAGAIALGGVTYVGLVAGDVLPDPRPRNGARVLLIIP